MSDPRDGAELPPDLPPEYAEAYRAGYERALRASNPDRVVEPVETPDLQSSGEFRVRGPLFADDQEPPAPEPASAPPSEPTHRAEPDDDRRGWLAPAVLAALVVVLLLGAYVVGRAFSDRLSADDGASQEPNGVEIGDATDTPEPSAEATPTPPEKPTPSTKPKAGKYAGDTTAATVSGAQASCETAASVDSAGNEVAYAASNVRDGDLTTAWRCDGGGSGETLRLALPGTTRIGEVGLVPGYAKTDARSGVDRYAENNRLTKVRWTFSDGTSVVQRLDPDPSKRDLQSIRIPLEKTREVTLEILGATGGKRNTVAVSEVRLGQAAG